MENLEDVVISETSSSNDGLSGDELSDSSTTLPSSFISAQNYITIKEGCQSAFTAEELTKAVSHCKRLVLESEECSEERKWLVRRLIELRHRLQQAEECQLAKEESVDIEETRVMLGHHFKLEYEPKSTSKKYCDRCCGLIWHIIQHWYQCTDCPYKCHVKCIDQTNRICAHLILSEHPHFEQAICPEIGLDAQCYRCYECQCSISCANSSIEARKCDYNGKYYCSSCHWNNLSIVPARAVRNWDFEPRPVSRASFHLIRHSKSKPIITLDPRLYSFVEELATVKKMRLQLGEMKHYVSTCRFALENSALMKELEWRHHLIHLTDVFSLDDLIDIQKGNLIPKINAVYMLLLKHIKDDCKVCFGRGHICGFCKSKDILFPFDEDVFVCPKCKSVHHSYCWTLVNKCPLCARFEEKEVL